MSGIGYYYNESGNIELILTQGKIHTYPWHMHARHWTAGLVRQGAVQLATETTTRKLHAGQHFFIRPYEPHSLSVEPESSLLVLCFAGSGTFPIHGDSTPPYCVPFLNENEKVWIDNVVAACKENIFPHESGKTAIVAYDSLLSRSIREVTRLIMGNPAEVLRIEQMASYAGYSQWHFIRLFQKETGITPHAYQLLCRLRMLRSLLRAGTAAVDAAMSAGFTDQSHMTKMFKLHHGLTPRQFSKASFMLEY